MAASFEKVHIVAPRDCPYLWLLTALTRHGSQREGQLDEPRVALRRGRLQQLDRDNRQLGILHGSPAEVQLHRRDVRWPRSTRDQQTVEGAEDPPDALLLRQDRQQVAQQREIVLHCDGTGQDVGRSLQQGRPTAQPQHLIQGRSILADLPAPPRDELQHAHHGRQVLQRLDGSLRNRGEKRGNERECIYPVANHFPSISVLSAKEADAAIAS